MAKKSKSDDKQIEVAVKKAVKSERKRLAKVVEAAEGAAARAEKAAAKAAGRAKSAKKSSKKAKKAGAASAPDVAPVDAGESLESVAPEADASKTVAQDAALTDASAKVAGDPLGSAGADVATPADDPHVGLTRAQLVVLAGERGVPNRSRLTKAQLLEALRTS